MFDHLLESSHRDDSNKWSNIGIGEEIVIIGMKYASYIVSCVLIDFPPLNAVNGLR